MVKALDLSPSGLSPRGFEPRRMHRFPKKQKQNLRQPGVEPGAKAWEASMLPIHHWRAYRKRAPGGTRTRNLCLRRAAPYPLGHRGNAKNCSERGLNSRPSACKADVITTRLSERSEKRKGRARVEPATYRAATDCSTTELTPHSEKKMLHAGIEPATFGS